MFLWAELVSDSAMLLAVLGGWLSAPWGCWRNEELDLLGRKVVSPLLALALQPVERTPSLESKIKSQFQGSPKWTVMWLKEIGSMDASSSRSRERCLVKVYLLIISLREWMSEGQAAAFSLLLREPPTRVCSNDNVKALDHNPQKMQQISSSQQCWCFPQLEWESGCGGNSFCTWYVQGSIVFLYLFHVMCWQFRCTSWHF